MFVCGFHNVSQAQGGHGQGVSVFWDRLFVTASARESWLFLGPVRKLWPRWCFWVVGFSSTLPRFYRKLNGSSRSSPCVRFSLSLESCVCSVHRVHRFQRSLVGRMWWDVSLRFLIGWKTSSWWHFIIGDLWRIGNLPTPVFSEEE